MLIGLRELCDPSNRGSPGAYYIYHHAKMSGYDIDFPARENKKYDVELLSIHHASDFLRLIDLPKIADIRLIGGHPMQNNARPVIPFADAVFVGEGETAIKTALKKIEKYGIDGLHNEAGWIISKDWKPENNIPATVIENVLPENPAYLNHAGTKSAAWYIEIARGCPYKCLYCELGHSSKYRTHNMNYIERVIESIDTKQSRKINIFAPDEASFPHYNEVMRLISDKGYSSFFSSMRIDTVQRNNIHFSKNHLIRLGIDGLTENTRFMVNKKIRNTDIIKFFFDRINEGYVQFKMFMIFGYEWEVIDDFKEFADMMEAVRKLPYKKNISLRIKWTPLIPQPCTPLKDTQAKYDYDMVQKIRDWHKMVKTPKGIGVYITNDGLMSEREYNIQKTLTAGGEQVLYDVL